MKRIVTKYPGVYQRLSETRTYKGKPDVCYDLSYKVDGQKVWEKAGWASEGYTPKLVNQIRADRLRSIRHGEELPKQKKKAPFFKDVATKYLAWAKDNKARNGKDDGYVYQSHLASPLRSSLSWLNQEIENPGLPPLPPYVICSLRTIFSFFGLAPGMGPALRLYISVGLFSGTLL